MSWRKRSEGWRDCKAHPDEKGIETDCVLASSNSEGIIARPIPTKRELKPAPVPVVKVLLPDIARPIPTKRELKQVEKLKVTLEEKIARPIPTKRELKRVTIASRPLNLS